MSQLPHYKTILYVTDLGTHTRPVFKHALSLAQAYQANVVMLHVVEPLGTAVEAVLSTYLPQDVLERVEHDGLKKIIERMRKRLETFRAEERELADVEEQLVSDVAVVHGRPDEEIMEQAYKYHADLIVIGSTTGGHHLLGTTARRITQVSTIPVLIIPNSDGDTLAK